MTVHIYFSNNSIRKTKLSCDDLGIHYDVSKSGKTITISRQGNKTYGNMVVGQFEFHSFRKDRIRAGPHESWRPMKEFFSKSGLFSHAMSFTANNGVKYIWKTKRNKLIMTPGGSSKSLITYHRHATRSSYLEISDRSTLDGLDTIILAFLIAERKRRKRQKDVTDASVEFGNSIGGMDGGGGGGGT